MLTILRNGSYPSRKFLHYPLLDSLIGRLLISQDAPRIEMFTRRENRMWLYAGFHGCDAVIKPESISCNPRLGDVYQTVQLPDSTG